MEIKPPSYKKDPPVCLLGAFLAEFQGRSETSSDPHGHPRYVSADTLIYGKNISESFAPFGGIGNGNSVSAPAEFVFPGASDEVLRSSQATLTLEFKGLNEVVVTQLPSHLKEQMLLIQK